MFALSPLRLLAPVVLLTVSLPVGAAEVQWRHDYDQARREARALNRPLLVDIGTEACYWCKRLDMSTFRDEAVIKTLNEQFIPVKLDGDRHPKLVKALGIDSYPTLVFAACAGHIFEIHPGYLDAKKLLEKLAAATASAAPKGTATSPQSLLTSTGELKAVKYEELTALVRSQRGKVVVVGIWGQSGQDTVALLGQLHQRYAGAGLVCLSVNVDPVARRPELIHFLSDKRMPFAHMQLDEERTVWQERWSLAAAPALYVFTSDGKLACRFTHEDGFGLPEVERHVQRLVAPQH
ncbi:MAG: DUF255 domain-containing protein [Gemmataceae bacterium]